MGEDYINIINIGTAAAQAGVNMQTLRYYERRGLIHELSRRPSGYRMYSSETVRLVRFIKGAQRLGFILTEIEELLRLREDKSITCPEVQATALAKVKEIDGRIKSLRAVKSALNTLIRSCAENGENRECPLLEALESEAQAHTIRSPVPSVKSTTAYLPGM